ncbi:RluA family pseudouridine synthase [Desulfofalx alkaliphila]|uniref:RluA family pseudouridine synthase n=1 Tax=Desulfofalx alkaliphila TaxID=105483 RepID=UPI0004E0F583|nr:RluA family pseudouridine synthase [Desulfofalx alkaliphila]
MEVKYIITGREAGRTVENFLYKDMGFSRTMIRKLKRTAGVRVNGKPVFFSDRLKAGDILYVPLDLDDDCEAGFEPQDIHIDIIHEDPHILVVNKPANMLVHPVAHEQHNTLANAVLFHYSKQNLKVAFRPVSRLDRDTSGLLVVAKNAHVGYQLAKQLKTGEFKRYYLGVVHGLVQQPQAVIALPIGRCKDGRVRHEINFKGRHSITHYWVVNHLGSNTVVKLRLETGRTHQIRVHMGAIGYPLVGDTLYGGSCCGINRQALHCQRLIFKHPITGELLTLDAPLPKDMQKLINDI